MRTCAQRSSLIYPLGARNINTYFEIREEGREEGGGRGGGSPSLYKVGPLAYRSDGTIFSVPRVCPTAKILWKRKIRSSRNGSRREIRRKEIVLNNDIREQKISSSASGVRAGHPDNTAKDNFQPET